MNVLKLCYVGKRSELEIFSRWRLPPPRTRLLQKAKIFQNKNFQDSYSRISKLIACECKSENVNKNCWSCLLSLHIFLYWNADICVRDCYKMFECCIVVLGDVGVEIKFHYWLLSQNGHYIGQHSFILFCSEMLHNNWSVWIIISI